MKIVFDTNVLIATFVFKGFSKEVFEYCFSYHQLYNIKERMEQGRDPEPGETKC